MELTAEENKQLARNRRDSSHKIDNTPKLDIDIPGLSKLFDRSSRKTTRIIWLITIIFCAIVCAYLTVHQLQEYFKYPTASKTVIERRQTVQFPSISVCTPDGFPCYAKELKKEIENKCKQKSITNCSVDTFPIRQLEIDLQDVWDRCILISVTATVEKTSDYVFKNPNDTDDDYKIINSHTALGPCATITHTKKVTYISAMTSLKINISSKSGLSEFLLFPHAEPELSTTGYELVNHEMETVLSGHRTQIKLREEIFQLKNITGRECYDHYDAKMQFKHLFLMDFNEANVCGLPFLSYDLPKCDTLDDFQLSLVLFYASFFTLLNESAIFRRICNPVTYGLSTDYVLPELQNHMEDSVNETATTVIVKFADDTQVVITEYYSYTFPALVSDLFAYWGFFLCLSALVFAEIIEFVIKKIYQWCKKRSKFRK